MLVRNCIYGALIGDIIGNSPKFVLDNVKNTELSAIGKKFMEDTQINSDISNISDRIIIMLRNVQKTTISEFELAKSLISCKKNGIPEMPKMSISNMSMDLNFVLNQESYLFSPIKSAKSSLYAMGGERDPNDNMSCVFVYGFHKEWYKNGIIGSLTLSAEGKTIVAGLVQCYLINCIAYGRPINWIYIKPICQKILNKSKINRTNNLLTFNEFWDNALNYRNFIDRMSFRDYLKKVGVGDSDKYEFQKSAMMSMMLSMIMAIDLGRNLKRENYYMERIQDVIHCGGDINSNCVIVGAFAGLVTAEFPAVEIPNKEWIDMVMDNFYKHI
jgi:hypothetical protein